MKTTKARTTANQLTDPVWCSRCSIRIAPYGMRTVHNGKVYHRDCYNKISQEKSQARKN